MKLPLHILILLIFMQGGLLLADTHTWDHGGTDTIWSNGTNWDQGNTAPVSSDDVLFTNNAGTVTIGTGNQTINNMNVVGSSAWTWSGSDTLILTGTLTYSNSSAGSSFNALLDGGGSVLVKTGNLTLGNANNTYSGGTTITGGKILLVGNNPSSIGSGLVTVSGGTLSRSGGGSATTTITNSVILNGDVSLGGVQETIELTGPITMTGDRTINSLSGAKISPGTCMSGDYTLRFTGTGACTLNRDNSGWNGAVIMNISTTANHLFAVGHANACGTSLVLRTGILMPPSTSPVTLAAPTAVTLDGDVRIGWLSGVSFNGPATLTGNRTLTLSGGDSTFAGTWSSTNRYTLTKSGANGLYLSGNNNTYTGDWNVVQGTMYFSTTNSIGAGQINTGTGGVAQLNLAVNWTNSTEFAGGGTIKIGNGSADRTLTTVAGNLSPGTTTNAGILTFQNTGGASYNTHLIMTNSGSSYSRVTIDVMGTNGVAGTDYDRLHVVKGNISGLANADLVVNVASALGRVRLTGQSLTVVLTDTGSVSGTFRSVRLPNAYSATVNYSANAVMISNLVSTANGMVVCVH